MVPRTLFVSVFSALLAVGAFAVCRREGRVLTDRYHHLGNDTTSDWKEADPKPEGKRLDLSFDARANASEWTLFLEQRSIDDPWRVRLNGKEFALLKPNPALLARAYPVPAGLVLDGPNVLSFVPDQPNDDVVIGKVRLVERSLREIYDTHPVTVLVKDRATNAPVPARVSFFDAAGAPLALYYADTPQVAARDGVLYVSDRPARIELARGHVVSVATRGVEWSSSRVEFDVGAANSPSAAAGIVHELARELDTVGFVAADTHLHTLQFSGHGDASALERQVTLAGEGVELAIATDHNRNTDYRPFQRELSLGAFYTAVTGNEVTTDVGHFNAFPLDPAAKVPEHESKDFATIVQGIRARGAEVVILNHPRWPNHDDSPFTNNGLDRDTGAFASGLELTMDATELVNSTTKEAEPLFVLQDWLALLNRGVRVFAVGSSDSHTVGDPVGGGRTWVPSATDDPARIDVLDACRRIREGRTSIGMGIFATISVRLGSAHDGADRAGPAVSMGETIVATSGRRLSVELRVQAPSWVAPRRAILFVNGTAVAERELAPRREAPLDERLGFDLPLEGEYDRHLVAAVVGDATAPFWPLDNPYTLAVTNPVFVDVAPAGSPSGSSGDGYTSPRATAERWLNEAGAPGPGAPESTSAAEFESLARRFSAGDDAIGVHVLDLLAGRLRASGADSREVRGALERLASRAPPAWERVRRYAARP